MRGATLTTWIFGGVLAVAGFAGSRPAEAQVATFCPANVGGQTNFDLQGTACTNGQIGAFSGAALASQALSDLTQSTTQETLRNTTDQVATRRREEEQRCPDGYTRVGGTCERITPRAAAPVVAAPVRPSRTAARKRRAPVVVATPIAPVVAPLPVLVSFGPRFSAWAQVFGDYERRTGSGLSSVTYLGVVNPLTIDVTSRTRTGGFIGGVDLTARGIAMPNDGFTVGVLTGYVSSNVRVSTTQTYLASPLPVAAGTPAGSASLTAHLSGPSLGFFATYFAGPFSFDVTTKIDFLQLDENFNQVLNYIGVAAVTATNNGSGSTRLTNASVVANANYRFQLSPQFWVEPTAGIQYTATSYSSSAAALGLDNGSLFRIQGGARFGTTMPFNGTVMTASLTTLAYDDVSVRGGFVPGAAFGSSNVLAKSDQNKLRGQAIAAVNFDMGNGVSAFAQADVRGGRDLFGFGGKAGIRYQW